MDWIVKMREGLNDLGFERARRTVAQLALAFFIIVYAMVSLAIDPEWKAAFVGLALCYLTAFLGLGSEWFWGRWFASGLGWSGMMVGIYALVTIGWAPPLAVYAVLHGIVAFALRGKKVASLYEGQKAWQERYGLDEHGVARWGKNITRSAASLPAMIIWALGPKVPDQAFAYEHLAPGMGAGLAPLLALAALVFGLILVIRRRTVGLILMAAAAALFVVGYEPSLTWTLADRGGTWFGGMIDACAPVAGAFLATALIPFVMPVVQYLRGRR